MPTVTVEVTVIEFQPGQANIAAEGAEVCVLDSSNCASTDAEGLVTLEAPENAETGFTGLRGGQLFALGMGEELARWDFGPAGRD